MSLAELPKALLDDILAHARHSPQAEVCGLIGAHEGRARSLYRVANVAREPRRRFVMDPRGQIDAMRRMRAAGETLFGIYHSHPDAPPVPSPTDLREAAYPEALYLIVSLTDGGEPAVRAYRLEGERAEAVALIRV